MVSRIWLATYAASGYHKRRFSATSRVTEDKFLATYEAKAQQ
jgi:hypothetical protein